jgi:ribosomal-protein-alanine N-acetyltransferase
MSAQWREDQPSPAPGALQAMTTSHLDAVLAIEVSAYAFPWSRGNFIDSLAAGYPAQVLLDAQGAMLGYFVAMGGVDEMHLLNITVAPAVQGRGHARHMIDALIGLCRDHLAHELWLEVRESNARARAIYVRLGFEQKRVRKGYYPAPFGRREDAIVMSLQLGGGDALE